MPNSPPLINESDFDRRSQPKNHSDRRSKRGKRKWKSFPSIRCATKQQANQKEDDHAILCVSAVVVMGHGNSDFNPATVAPFQIIQRDWTCDCDLYIEPELSDPPTEDSVSSSSSSMQAHSVLFGQQQLNNWDWHVNCELYQEHEWSDPRLEQSSPGTLPLDQSGNVHKDTPLRDALRGEEFDETKVLQFPTEDRNSENAAQSIIPGTAESLAIALKSTLQYTFHLLNEFAPELVRQHAHQNVAAVRNGDFFNVFLPNLQEVLARLRQLLD